MKKAFFLFSIILMGTCLLKAEPQTRTVINFNKDWCFYLGNDIGAWKPNFDDSGWRKLNLPHDWSIEGQFDVKNPSGVDGGALPGGIGWYRKTFVMPDEQRNKPVFIDFDGVYRNSEVWVNGHSLGVRPYGFSSFRYDLTHLLQYKGRKNVIAVKVDNSQQPNSRWYSGSGIFRNVWMVYTQKVYVEHWGTYVTTPEVTDQSATVDISYKIRNNDWKDRRANIISIVYDNDGKEVARTSIRRYVQQKIFVQASQNLKIQSPKLWSLEHPYLYKLVTKIEADSTLTDIYETSFGIRSFSFDNQKGFILNGKLTKIKGVCLHHDLGCLGSAINKRALQRQLEIMKSMGCNAIRTSHNPPAPELLDLCDQMGLIVMDEAFDMWKKSKNKFDYSQNWDEWHKRDLEDMIIRDRNHPSVFIWSIGNEIPEQKDSTGIAITRELASIVHNLDNTRPITAANNHVDNKNFLIKSQTLDLIGTNYNQAKFNLLPQMFPGQRFIATETTSALATRGAYDMPSEVIRRWETKDKRNNSEKNNDMTCSSYDNCSAPWGSTHEETWKLIKKLDYISGMFIWTGFDYIGEPTPYPWPARSSYFGIVDLCGFPKDAYYMYQSEWTNNPVLHIFPHWNWKKGEKIDVWAYSNCDEVELFLNDKSLGTQRKQGDALHLIWKVPFKPGTLKAIGRTNGKTILTSEIKTAEAPAKLILSTDRDTIHADDNDLSFITIKIADKNGTLVPYADNLVKFTLSGDASIAGVDNGNPISMEMFKDNKRKAFNGMCLAVIKAGEKTGTVTLTATSEGLEPATIVIKTK